MTHAPYNRSNDLRLAIAFALAVLSCSVLAGWLLRSLAMVEVVPNAEPLPFAAALGLLLISINHWLARRTRKTRTMGRALSGVVLAIGVLAILQFLLDRNLGLDLNVLHRWLVDDGSVPGRVSLVLGVGLALCGAAGWIDRPRLTPMRARVMTGLIFLLLADVLLAIALNWFKLSLVYDWATSITSSLPAAIALAMSAALVCLQRHRYDKFRSLEPAETEQRILLVGGMLVALAALTAGLLGFTSQQQALGQTLANGLQASLVSRVQLFRTMLDNAAQQATHLATTPRLAMQVKALLSPGEGLQARRDVEAELQAHLDQIVAGGHSGVALYTPDGQLVMMAGHVGAASDLETPIDSTGTARLIWRHGLYVRLRFAIVDGGAPMADLVVERDLQKAAADFYSTAGFGATGQFWLCARDGNTRVCYPRMQDASPQRVTMGEHGSKGAMDLAFSGEQGVIQTRDYRGREVIAAYSPLGPNLGVVLKQDTGELYTPVRQALRFVVPLVLLLAGLAAAALRLQLQPMLRSISSARKHASEQESRVKTVDAQLSYQLSHDALTHLPNRVSFETRIDAVLEAAAAAQPPVEHALLILDLDQFKVVNDSCGHLAGDELLRRLTEAMTGVLRASDLLARIGGDEFALLLERCGPQPAARVAETLRAAVADMTFEWNGKQFRVGASIGLVSFGKTRVSRIELMRAADLACYLAKQHGRNRVETHDIGSDEIKRHTGELNWVSRLQQALDDDRFELYRQKIVPVAADASVEAPQRYEILLRLRETDGSLIAPGAFIPAAERYGLMPAIDRWVVAKALVTMREMAERGEGQTSRYSINLSGASINDASMPAFLLAQVNASGVDPTRICFEVTETAAIANLDTASRIMQSLRDRGCQFALDDFGAGMSSFAYLRQLPVDYLKIDGSFIKNIVDDAVDLAMVEAVHSIGRRLGLKTVAEFVENDAILARLRSIGVDYAQGYGIARPEPMPGASTETPAASAPGQATATVAAPDLQAH